MSYEVGTNIRFSERVEEHKTQRLWDVGSRIVFVKFAESIAHPLAVSAA